MSILPDLGRLLLRAAAWGTTAAAVSSIISAAARTACLPPYWPASFVLRCRVDPLLAVFVRALLDALVTTLLLLLPAAVLGLLVHAVLLLLRQRLPERMDRFVAASMGLVCWFILIQRLEVSYLDFIVSWYAVAAGGILAGASSVRDERTRSI